METGTNSNSGRSLGSNSQSTNSNKGQSGAEGGKPLMSVAGLNGPGSQNQPVAEPQTPHELTLMPQRLGTIVYSLLSVAVDLSRAGQNPTISADQKQRIEQITSDLYLLQKKVFNCGHKLSNVFLKPKRKRV